MTNRLTAGPGSGWRAASGHDVWISNVAAGTVAHIDAQHRKVVGTVAVGPSPQDGDASDGAVRVPLRNGVVVPLDARTEAVTARWESGVGNPFVLDADGDRLWTADFIGTD